MNKEILKTAIPIAILVVWVIGGIVWWYDSQKIINYPNLSREEQREYLEKRGAEPQDIEEALKDADDYRRVNDVTALTIALEDFVLEHQRFPAPDSWMSDLAPYLLEPVRADLIDFDYAACGTTAVVRTRLESSAAVMYFDNGVDVDEATCGLPCGDSYYCAIYSQ
jgi:hypothetical protein